MAAFALVSIDRHSRRANANDHEPSPAFLSRRRRALTLFVALFSHSGLVEAAAIRMAVMGDSISAGSGVSGGSPNWVAQLSSTFSSAITFQNKAVGGATSSTVISGQLSQVESLASNHQIDDSTLIIGGNDATSTAAIEVALGGDPTSFINSYVNNIKTIINGIATANPSVHQVFGNMPDVTVTPEVQSVAASSNIPPAGLQLLSAAIGQADAQADAYALAHNVAVVNLYKASQVITDAIPITLAGHQFTTAFAPDGFHPAPFLQGLLANMVNLAYNEKFHQSLPQLSDQQIVHNVGSTPTGSTSFFNVQPYVIVPEPAAWHLAAIGGAVLLAGRLGGGCDNRVHGPPLAFESHYAACAAG